MLGQKGKLTPPEIKKDEIDKISNPLSKGSISPELHYNIQVNLPAAKDLEVYNAIFRSLREHFVDR
ncbi:MAG: hypothetical protein JOY99_08625 [Sphingomonadaceae bacterium]|nr:hypothetical protein [Sphingomonadaceae bacterium]